MIQMKKQNNKDYYSLIGTGLPAILAILTYMLVFKGQFLTVSLLTYTFFDNILSGVLSVVALGIGYIAVISISEAILYNIKKG